MGQTKNGSLPKGHIRSFWPLVIIAAIAVIMGILVYSFEFSLETDYNLNSTVLTIHRRFPETKTKAKIPVRMKSSSTSTTTTTK